MNHPPLTAAPRKAVAKKAYLQSMSAVDLSFHKMLRLARRFQADKVAPETNQ